MTANKAGVLLHPTSLPSPYGIGDLGQGAYQFIDFLVEGGQRLWQILPLGPVGYGESPYQCFSAFAGYHMLLSLDQLVQEGLLTQREVAAYPRLSTAAVEYQQVQQAKDELLRQAFQRFLGSSVAKETYQQFQQEHKLWLEDYALFMALKKHYQGLPWNKWDGQIAFRHPQALAAWQEQLAKEVEYHKFLQFQFFQQWSQLKQYANSKGIEIMGDVPIFISYDSSDAWANPELFQLDEAGNPEQVAGVPPDYFSATGQLWGNPHYHWDVMAKDDYKWWRQRLQFTLTQVDLIRIDHFRGFEAYWQVPGDAKTAAEGEWVIGPGAHFFATIEKYLGSLPLVAEDLGLITPPVHQLRKQFNLPGMQVLHFLLEGGGKDLFNGMFQENAVFYTGTHDNDTTVGWYNKSRQTQGRGAQVAEKFLQIRPELTSQEACWRLIKVAMNSHAQRVIIPLQDVLALDSHTRMNTPGTVGGSNWQWRFTFEQLTSEIVERLKQETKQAGR